MKPHRILTFIGIIGAATWFTLCDKFFHIDNDGCFWEGATSKLGYFDYHYTNIFNVPLWLFACYLHAGFLMLDLQSLRESLKRSGK